MKLIQFTCLVCGLALFGCDSKPAATVEPIAAEVPQVPAVEPQVPAQPAANLPPTKEAEPAAEPAESDEHHGHTH